MDDSDYLGPLPQSDDNSLLQAESFKALESALPSERFVLRPEAQPDAGVDWCVELRIGGRYTGMRAHIQVKATEGINSNSDGSISYSADVSNINYLLNGSSPLYVVYLAQAKELRYAWIRDEVSRIEGENPNWKQQKTVTLRFTRRLDEQGLQNIHDRIRREAKLDREIHDLLSRADVCEQTIHVNLRESKVTDPAEIRELLLKGGMTLVSWGEAQGVLEAFEKLSYADKNLPRLLLVRAFAECSRGRYQMAVAHLAEASIKANELTDSDRPFLGLLRDICDYQAGRITRAEYVRRQKDLSEKDEGEFGLSRKIDYIWEAILGDGTRSGIATHLPILRAIVGQVFALEDGSDSLRIHARTALLYGEGVRYIRRFSHDFAMLKARIAMGRAVDVNGVIGDLNADQARWTNESNALVQDALKHGNPHLIGDACYIRSFIQFVHLSSAPLWLKPEALSHHLENLKAQVIPDLQRAIQCYELSGHIEWELRAKNLLADVAALAGDEDLAREMAETVLPIAEAYQFDRIATEARDHLAGNPFFRQMQRQHILSHLLAPDKAEAGLPDEKLGQYAEDVLEASGLPRDRLAVVTREVTSYRDIARERVAWCRHIRLIQDLRHTMSPLTYYAYDPIRFCYCEKYEVASKIGDTDWTVVIKTFKSNYCSGCPAREPISESSH